MKSILWRVEKHSPISRPHTGTGGARGSMAQNGTHRGMREDGVVAASDGTRIAYSLYRGEGRARLALVHSLAMDRHFWDAVVSELDPAFDVLAYDCRGHGASDKPSSAYSVELFAHDLADLMNSIGWSNAVVAGASMGGCVSLAFAAGYPERTAGLGLIDTTAWYGADAPKAWAERADKALAGGMSAMVDFQKSRWFSDAFRAANPDLVDRAVRTFVANDVNAYARTCEMLGACDMRSALSSFNMPVSIAVGEEDYATPVAMAEAMRSAIPNARFQTIESVRHFTPLEVPGKIAAVLQDLCQEVSFQ